MDTSPAPGAAQRGDSTREALLQAARRVFAERGFDAVSTREIAEAAGINQALIGYHFDGKEGLYLAVFDQIRAHAQERLGATLAPLRELLDRPDIPLGKAARRKTYVPPLLAVVEAMLSMMLSPETEHWAQLITREQARPTAAFDLIYNGFFGRTLDLLTRLAMRLRADDDERSVRLLVVGILGQVVVWRAAREGVMRQMKWDSLGAARIAQIKESVRRNITAQLLA